MLTGLRRMLTYRTFVRVAIWLIDWVMTKQGSPAHWVVWFRPSAHEWNARGMVSSAACKLPSLPPLPFSVGPTDTLYFLNSSAPSKPQSFHPTSPFCASPLPLRTCPLPLRTHPLVPSSRSTASLFLLLSQSLLHPPPSITSLFLQPLSSGASLQMAIVALHFACVALNAAYVGPRTLEIMKQRERLEKDEGKGCHEEGVSASFVGWRDGFDAGMERH